MRDFLMTWQLLLKCDVLMVCVTSLNDDSDANVFFDPVCDVTAIEADAVEVPRSSADLDRVQLEAVVEIRTHLEKGHTLNDVTYVQYFC